MKEQEEEAMANLKWMTDQLGERQTPIYQGLPPPLPLPPQANLALLNIGDDGTTGDTPTKTSIDAIYNLFHTCFNFVGGSNLARFYRDRLLLLQRMTIDPNCHKGKTLACDIRQEYGSSVHQLLILSPEDVLPTVYLCTNKIAPDQENTNFQTLYHSIVFKPFLQYVIHYLFSCNYNGGSIVTAAIEEACGTNKLKIREMYNTLGDLGDAAQLCCQTQKLFAPPTSLLIRRVYSVLHEISIVFQQSSIIHTSVIRYSISDFNHSGHIGNFHIRGI
ncbi:unnamed protein product [Lactuca saligna]|uniref:DNA ligase ATP-dependent N-terminal domain-containing protein n=1 Tax=Lactuca saligna TaxID=75948 RepID=A0AA36EK69_LACSI|nr:unnamed protein product [Lactuca saligna]